MNIEESIQQIETLIEAWELDEAELNQTDIEAIKFLLKENQELKNIINQIGFEPDEIAFLQQENAELKKQVENYKKLGFEYLQDKNNKLETQQKEFIEYMNKTIEELECDDVDDEEMKGYLIQRIDTFKEILSKYKSIIGGKDAIK